MAEKQPYIPLYTGDYLKDTRRLPLAARGAWVDLMIFMWDSKERGVLVGTMPEYAMMMSCTLDEANFAIGLLRETNSRAVITIGTGWKDSHFFKHFLTTHF
jgi:hypothetical protein